MSITAILAELIKSMTSFFFFPFASISKISDLFPLKIQGLSTLSNPLPASILVVKQSGSHSGLHHLNSAPLAPMPEWVIAGSLNVPPFWENCSPSLLSGQLLFIQTLAPKFH